MTELWHNSSDEEIIAVARNYASICPVSVIHVVYLCLRQTCPMDKDRADVGLDTDPPTVYRYNSSLKRFADNHAVLSAESPMPKQTSSLRAPGITRMFTEPCALDLRSHERGSTRRIEARELINTVRRVAKEKRLYQDDILHLNLAAAELERLSYPSDTNAKEEIEIITVEAIVAHADKPDSRGLILSSYALKTMVDDKNYFWDETRQALVFRGPVTLMKKIYGRYPDITAKIL